VTAPSAAAVPTLTVRGASDRELGTALRGAGITLTLDEARKVARLLGRDPTLVEANIFNTMWSEHCSYKSSRAMLGRHLPTEASHVILGPGEDAGIVRLAERGGKSYCLAIAHESHNHPSQIVPNEGAATGIGGIVRDVYCMGADVVGVMDALRFGDPTGDRAERTREIVHGVVEGIWQYGNALGVPNLGGDVVFDGSFDDNCLVNVVAVGLIEESDIIRSRVPEAARGRDYDVVLVGKPTDPSGFGGATFASRILDEDRAVEDKYAVQVPDPFLKRMITVATVEVLKLVRERGAAIGFKDLGAGGIACATSELGAAAGLGVRVDLSSVVVAEEDMLPEVIACSETQERYCLVVPRELTPDVLGIYNEDFELPELCHGARAVVIGEVIEEPRYVLLHEGNVVCDASTEQITTGIAYDRQARPRIRSFENVAPPDDLDVGEALVALLASPNIASREHVFRHYDSEVKGLTAVRPGEADAGVIVPVPGEDFGVAVSVDGNPFLGALDPYEAGAAAVAEAVRNVAAVGAVPIALTDCLNFGNPESPEVFDDFVEVVRGVGDAARKIGMKDSDEPIPIVSGNVSFYNQSAAGNAILPSPIVCCAGFLEHAGKHLTMGVQHSGNAIYLIGRRWGELGGSAFLRVMRGETGRTAPRVRFDEERAMMAGVTDLADSGSLVSCHDVSDGGALVALAEMLLAAPRDRVLGVALDLSDVGLPDMETAFRFLFSENGGYVAEAAPEREAEVRRTLEARGVWFVRLGETTDSGSVAVLGLPRGAEVSVDVQRLEKAWRTGMTEVI